MKNGVGLLNLSRGGIINEEDGLEMIPVLPVVCSDGNCRSHKEKVNKFWETILHIFDS